MSDTLEICTDASIRTFENGRVFGCAGALCINTGESEYVISQDTTNNRSELLGIYLGIRLAEKIYLNNPDAYDEIKLYSDSQFGIFGLTRWMDAWLERSDPNGILYGTNNKPVKNQELFKAIITYLTTHNMRVKMLHQSGHVSLGNTKKLAEANAVFLNSNGYLLRPEEIYKISYYNDIVDRTSRDKLQYVNPNDYPVMDYSENYNVMCSYVIPANYKEYVC
jgi:ribonuclease HI